MTFEVGVLATETLRESEFPPLVDPGSRRIVVFPRFLNRFLHSVGIATTTMAKRTQINQQALDVFDALGILLGVVWFLGLCFDPFSSFVTCTPQLLISPKTPYHEAYCLLEISQVFLLRFFASLVHYRPKVLFDTTSLHSLRVVL